MRRDRVVRFGWVSACALSLAAAGVAVAGASPVDGTPPQTAISSSVPEVVGPTDALPITFVGTDDVTPAGQLTFECSIDGAAYSACTSPVAGGPRAGGSHSLSVRAKDLAGNTDPHPAQVTWSVDDQPPTTTIDPYTATGQEAVSFHGTDDHTAPGDLQFQCAFSSQMFALPPEPTSFSPCTSPIGGYTPLAQGWWKVRAVDAAGNVGPAASLQAHFEDRTQLDTQILSGPTSHTSATSATFSLQATDLVQWPAPTTTPISGFRCSLDGVDHPCAPDFAYVPAGGSWPLLGHGTGTLSLTGLAPGPHVLAVNGRTSADPAPTGIRMYWYWIVDTAAPTATIVSTPPAATPDAPGLVAFSTTDDLSHREHTTSQCSLDDAAFSACSSPFILPSLAVGAHHLVVRSTDEAGNTSADATAAWTVSAVASTTTSSTMTSSTTTSSTTTDPTSSTTTTSSSTTTTAGPTTTSATPTTTLIVDPTAPPSSVSGETTGTLPVTGDQVAGLVAAGLVLVAGGLAALVAVRRRQT
jgi:LPXTG-motif cell wall-anchored protein